MLRIGVAFSLLYPPFSALFDPISWAGYIPQFLRGYVPDLVFLHAFGALEVVLALWILSGKKIFWPSLVTALLLLAIVAFNANQMEVLFRDLSLAAMALALALFARADAVNPR